MIVVLCEGFRGHSVLITLNGRRVFEAADVTTDPLTARAGAAALSAVTRVARLAVSVTPGPLAAAADVDVAKYPTWPSAWWGRERSPSRHRPSRSAASTEWKRGKQHERGQAGRSSGRTDDRRSGVARNHHIRARSLAVATRPPGRL